MFLAPVTLLAASLCQTLPLPMRIAILTSEAVPFAKTGGLADVSGALPKALQRTGRRREAHPSALRSDRSRAFERRFS